MHDFDFWPNLIKFYPIYLNLHKFARENFTDKGRGQLFVILCERLLWTAPWP